MAAPSRWSNDVRRRSQLIALAVIGDSFRTNDLVNLHLPQPPAATLETKESFVADERLGITSQRPDTPTTISRPSCVAPIWGELVTCSEIPDWYGENPSIVRGYRPVSDSARACLGSLFYLHNESVNVYLHLLPALGFLAAEVVMFRCLDDKYPDSTFLDRFVFGFYVATVVVSLTVSVLYHLFLNHSERIAHISLQNDLIGILVLTFGVLLSGIYVTFYCKPNVRWGYWLMSGFLCLFAMVMLMSPALQGRRWRSFRICTFVGVALSAIVPIVHGLAMFGGKRMVSQTGLPYFLGEGALLGLGAFLYATCFPECIRPGKFDIWGASHQLFHLLVVLATIVHLVGITLAYNYTYNHNHQCTK